MKTGYCEIEKKRWKVVSTTQIGPDRVRKKLDCGCIIETTTSGRNGCVGLGTIKRHDELSGVQG